jgi:hypothetical protein
MKKYLLVITVISLFVLGCTEQMSVNTPIDNSTKKVEWLTIKTEHGLSVEGTRTWSKYVYGANGATFYATKSLCEYTSAYVKIQVPAGAFEGYKTISATLNCMTIYADFAPTPTTFNIPIYYTVEYRGVDLSGIDPTNVDFYYIDLYGNMVKATYDQIYVDTANNILGVVNARLPHFSRYGFVN